MQLYNNGRLYVKKYNLSVQFLLTSAVLAATETTAADTGGFFLIVASFSAFVLRYWAYMRFSLFTDCRTSCSFPCLSCVVLSAVLSCAVFPSFLPCAFPLLLPCVVPLPFLSCAVLPPFLPLYSMPSADVLVCTVFLLSATWTELFFYFIFPSATLFSATVPAAFGPCCTVRTFLPLIFVSGTPFTFSFGFSFVWIIIGLSSTFLMFNLHHPLFWSKKTAPKPFLV